VTTATFAGVTFVLAAGALLAGLALLRRLFAAGGSMFAVGRLLLEEASRQRGILLSLLLFVGCLAGLPLVLGTNYPLAHRVQSYLSYAQPIAALFLSFLTVLFASRHIAGELGEGPAATLFTKPLSSMSYVVGKFFALALLNLLLVAVASGIVFATVRVHFSAEPADDETWAELESQVLVGRQAVTPTPPLELIALVDERFAALEPEWIVEQGGTNAVLQDLERQVELSWRSVPVGSGGRTFVFDGLGEAKGEEGDDGVPPLQLRYRLYASPRPADGRVDLALQVGGEPLQVAALTNRVSVTELSARAVDAAGRLEVTVTRAASKSGEEVAVAFVGRDGLEVLYPVSGFGSNLSRGMAVRWLRLTCLGMLAALASTFLSFAVAAVFSLTGLLVATSSPYVLQVLSRGDLIGHEGHAHSTGGHASHAHAGEEPFYENVVEPVMGVVARVLGEYSRVNVTERLVDGRVISWGDVVEQSLWLGLGWSGACGLLAVFILRRRELAKVQV
jgi:hypothetical protein